MNQSAMLTRFARETDIDVVLCAGRYTLLEQGALDELLPACTERGVAVLVGGVMNSGVLANPRRREHVQLRDRAQRRRSIGRHGSARSATGTASRSGRRRSSSRSPTRAVASLVTGVRSVAHLDEYPAFARQPIPPDLWADLRAEGLAPPRRAGAGLSAPSDRRRPPPLLGPRHGGLPVADRRAGRDPPAVRPGRSRAASPGSGRRRDRPRPDAVEPRGDAPTSSRWPKTRRSCAASSAGST